MNNRILAMLLAIIMIVSIVPVNAFAAECSHTFDTTAARVSTNDGNHKVECNKCHTKVSYPCTYGDDPVCDFCGYVKEHTHTDTSDGECDVEGCDVHVHKVVKMEAKDPNCTEGGNLEYYYCAHTDCGKVFKDAEGKVEGRKSDYILNPVHKGLENREAVAADCTNAGRTAFTYCSACQTYFSDAAATTAITYQDTVVDALGHKLTKVEAVPNTCKELGNIAYYVCGTCDKYFEDDQAAKEITNKNHVNYGTLADHTWSKWTGTDESGHIKTCSVCGKTNTKQPHGNFTYKDGKQTCGDCGFTYDHVCVDTYQGGNHKCDKCHSEMPHDVVWRSNDLGKHKSVCEKADCYKAGQDLTEWEDCVDTDKDCKCDTCGYEFEHQFGNGYSYTDATGHYKVCTVCGAHGNTISHNTFKYENGKKICSHCNYEYDHVCVDTYAGGNHKCDECGSEMEHDLEWVIGTDNHYQMCKLDNCYFKEESKTEKEPHADENDDCKCDDCNKQLAHEFSREYTYTDGVFHYQECKCGEQQHKLYHSFIYEDTKDGKQHVKKCKVCDYSVNQDHADENGNHSCDVCDAELTHNVGWNNNGQGKHYQYCKDEKCYKKTLTTWADCTDANKDCKCDDCGAQLAHDLKTVERVEAKCGIAGNKGYKVCETCGALFNLAGGEITEEDTVIPALQHKWWPKGLDLSGTLHTEMCEYCKVISFKSHFDNTGDCMCDYAGCTEAAHEHTIVHVEAKAPTCVEEGYQEYWKYAECGKEFADAACTQPLTQKVVYGTVAHTWGAWTGAEDGVNHERECSVCGAKETATHVFNGQNPYCQICNTPDGLEFQPEVPATCTQNGVAAHYKSSITNRRYWDAAGTRYISNLNDLVILAQHELTDWMPGATGEHVRACKNCRYMEEGVCATNDNNCVCDTCGYMMLGHSMTYVEAKAATCTKNGNLAAWYCAKCDKYYDAETVEYLPTVVVPALGHSYQANWYNDTREGTHSKICTRPGCSAKISEEHDLTIEDTYTGNLHEASCSICNYAKTAIHIDSDGDTICDDCGYDSDKTVDVGALDNPRVTVTVKGDKDDTVEEKKSTWWKSFVDKLNPSYVGESQSSSAPSTSVESSLPNGTGVSSGSTGANQTPATNPSTVGAVIDFLVNLLSNLFGL